MYGHWAQVAGQKRVGIVDWEPRRYKVVDDHGTIQLDGLDANKSKITVYVSKDDIERAAEEYRVTTGNCSDCLGKGETLVSAHVNGTRTYRECFKCGGEGKAL